MDILFITKSQGEANEEMIKEVTYVGTQYILYVLCNMWWKSSNMCFSFQIIDTIWRMVSKFSKISKKIKKWNEKVGQNK